MTCLSACLRSDDLYNRRGSYRAEDQRPVVVMKLNAPFVSFAALTLLAAPMAHAEQYVKLQLNQTTVVEMTDECDEVEDIADYYGINASCDEADQGHRIALGVSLSDHLSVEGGYQDLGSVGFTLSDDSGFEKSYNDIDGFDLIVVGRVPLSDSIALTANVGMFMWNIESSYHTSFYDEPELSDSSGHAKLFGAGLEISFLTLNYDKMQDVGHAGSSGKSDLERISAGIKLTF